MNPRTPVDLRRGEGEKGRLPEEHRNPNFDKIWRQASAGDVGKMRPDIAKARVARLVA